MDIVELYSHAHYQWLFVVDLWKQLPWPHGHSCDPLRRCTVKAGVLDLLNLWVDSRKNILGWPIQTIHKTSVHAWIPELFGDFRGFPSVVDGDFPLSGETGEELAILRQARYAIHSPIRSVLAPWHGKMYPTPSDNSWSVTHTHTHAYMYMRVYIYNIYYNYI